jgi:hypothetical protein
MYSAQSTQQNSGRSRVIYFPIPTLIALVSLFGCLLLSELGGWTKALTFSREANSIREPSAVGTTMKPDWAVEGIYEGWKEIIGLRLA